MEQPDFMSLSGLFWALGWTLLGYLAGSTVERVRARLRQQDAEAATEATEAVIEASESFDKAIKEAAVSFDHPSSPVGRRFTGYN